MQPSTSTSPTQAPGATLESIVPATSLLNACTDTVVLSDALSETHGLWSSHEKAARGAHDKLYEFLGAIYEHGATFSRNDLALAELRRTVRQLYVTGRWQRTASAKSAHELLLLASMGLASGSLRSKYKRVLLEAGKAEVPTDRESFKLWLRGARGIVEILGTALPVDSPDDTYSEETPESLQSRHSDMPAASSGRNEAIAAIRRDLMTKSMKSMPIPMIENAPPADTFAIVIYRVEASRLVPCLCSDDTGDINAFLRSIVRRRSSAQRPSVAANSDATSPPTHGVAVLEAA